MKTLRTIILLFLSSSCFAQTPNYLWARSSVSLSGGSNFPNGLSKDVNGNTYVVGSFGGNSVSFGDTTLNNVGPAMDEMFLVKYDSLGNVVWARRAGAASQDKGWGVATDTAGNVYVTGSFEGFSITFGAITLITSGYADVFIAKYDPSGNVLWAKKAGGAKQDEGYGIAVDGSGNVILTGCFYSPTIIFGNDTLTNSGSSFTSDIFVVKYDALGNVIWAHKVGGTADEQGRSIATDLNGNVLVTGNFGSAILPFGTDTLLNTTSPQTDIFILKYNSLGNAVWIKSGEGASSNVDYGQDVSLDSNGNAYVTGNFQSDTISFGAISLINAFTGRDDGFIVKYDTSGNVIWAKRFGGSAWDLGKSVFVETSGNVLVTGNFSSPTITFGTFNLISSLSDVFFVKYDLLGNVIWAKNVGDNSSDDYGCDIISDENENIIVTGTFNGAPNFGDSTFYNSGGGTEMFLLKFNNPKSVVWPGDVNTDHIVDNKDILPIGLSYNNTGFSRLIQNNLWQADTSLNWGISEKNGADIKNADCNGDGIIDDNDTLAININFSSTHAFSPFPDADRQTVPDIYFVTSSSSYSPGQYVDAEIWLGNSLVQANNLYGISFNVSYDASLVQPGTEEITYPNSWLGSPGIDAIKISKMAPIVNTAYGGFVRTDHTNSNGYGKIADFKFQVKNTLASNDTVHFGISSYIAVDQFGNHVFFNVLPSEVQVSVGINEEENFNNSSIYPNPFNSFTNISYALANKTDVIIDLFNAIGEKLETLANENQTPGNYTLRFSAKEKGYAIGIYFVRVTFDGKSSMKKMVVIE